MQMKRIFQTVLYLVSFGFARGTLFVAPIILANSLSSRDYGALEWAHAAASLGATVVALGTASAMPLVALKRTAQGSQRGILCHHLGVAAACVGMALAAGLAGAGRAPAMAALLTAAIALQVLWSVHLKSHGRGEASLMLDSCMFTLVAAVALAAKWWQWQDVLGCVLYALAAYVACLAAVTGAAVLGRARAGEAPAYRATLRLGLPLMLGALVTIAATTSGRLLIAYLGGALLTADYAVLARAAALPIIAHQVVLVAKFRKLYELPDREMEKVVLLILSLVTASVLVFWSLSPYLGWMLGGAFVRTFSTHSAAAVPILVQAILWSAISLNDTVNIRQQTMLKVLPASALALLLAVPAAVVLVQFLGVSLLRFVYVHGAVMLLFYLAQVGAMVGSGIRLWRPWGFAVAAYVLLTGLAAWLYR
ncbi:hypothetical protein ACFDR9_001738 [Janthinobacterium sp. CG_23.3]|uniref:hypothetical protein n=1 Tax=unclassified Janthinobacterium TaxID=2610881 RepID=UPI002E0AC7E3|nr:hypothetical protein [Janthinobacterium sp. CG_S6]